MKLFIPIGWLALASIAPQAVQTAAPPDVNRPQALVVVKDLGSTSALPYYEALGMQWAVPAQSRLPDPPPAPQLRYSESDLLPVQSAELTPGQLTPRAIHMPGLSPVFMVGADAASRTWLKARADRLRDLRAVGFVVNVDSAADLGELRALAPGVLLVPSAGDDLAERLNLKHYPVLITATRIEQ